jgi:hypothetical protein
MQYLAFTRDSCAAGDQFVCGEAARWEAQTAQEAQADSNTKTAVAGVDIAAIPGTVTFGLASDDRGYLSGAKAIILAPAAVIIPTAGSRGQP